MSAAADGPSRVVAIDGTAGSGKSTVSRAVAAELGVDALDTGAMYRAVTVGVLAAGADPADPAAASEIAATVSVDGDGHVSVDRRDVTAEVRSPEVTAAVSTVAAIPAVREVLVARQRAWVAERGGGVVEGRDIGTVVFPDAPLKVFLTASEEERARRRSADERDGAAGGDVSEIRESLARRDARDSNRVVSPLRPAEDALVVDTTGRGPDEVVAEVLGEVRKVFGT